MGTCAHAQCGGRCMFPILKDLRIMRVMYLGVASVGLSLEPLEEARKGEHEIKHREPICLTELDVSHIFPCLTLIPWVSHLSKVT